MLKRGESLPGYGPWENPWEEEEHRKREDERRRCAEERAAFLAERLVILGYEVARLKGWLQYIADIAFDRDGYKDSQELGQLVDELRAMALKGLDGKQDPVTENRRGKAC